MRRRWGLVDQQGELGLGHVGQHRWVAMDVGGGARKC